MIISIGDKIPKGYFKNPAGHSKKMQELYFL